MNSFENFTVAKDGDLVTLNLTQLLMYTQSQHRMLEEKAPTLDSTGVLVFLMQSGFALLESGTVRFKNYQNILLKNCLDACIGGVIFWLCGFGFAYGGDKGG